MDIRNELLMLQAIEPLVLLLGENFDKDRDADIAKIKWSCVYSLRTESEIIKLFNNNKRNVKSIVLRSDLEKYSWNTNEMPFIWLQGHDEFLSEKRNEVEIESDAINMFFDITKRLKEFGRVVCVGFDPDSCIIDAKEISRICYFLKRKKMFYLLESNEEQLLEDKKLSNLIENGYVIHNNDRISDIFIYNQEDMESEEEDNANSDVLIYAGGKPVRFDTEEDKNAIFLMTQFAELLNYRDVMKNIPIPQEQEYLYFKNFLKNDNMGSTQWFGYRPEYGFHLVRDFEEKLYEKTIAALRDASTRRREQKPIMVCGQACSGKTSALKALAVRIFTEQMFPVIYISDAELNFNISYTDEGGVMQFSAFDRLEDVLHIIEDKEENAVATLVIWDTAAHNFNSRYKAIDLLTALRSYGRRVQLVCSSYDFIEKQDKLYDIVNVGIDMPDTEWKKIMHFFQKVGLSEEDIEIYIKKYGENVSFLSTLYMVDELKECLQERVSREVVLGTKEMTDRLEEAVKEEQKENFFENSIAEALRKAFGEAGECFESIYIDYEKDTEELEKKYKDFIIMLSICKWYGKEMPYTLLLRLLGGYSSESQKVREAVLSATFLKFDEDESNHWKSTVSVRSELEAKLLLLDCDINPLSHEGKSKVLEYILKLLEYISESSINEINMMRGILKFMGPNTSDNPFSDKSIWNDVYEEIPDILEKLRKKREEGDNNYILQEVSFRREYYQDNRCELSDDEKYRQYNETKNIADIRIGELRREEEILGTTTYGMSPILSSLLVESSNITLRMYNLKCSENHMHRDIFKIIYGQMMEVIKRDSKNAYAYSAVIQAGIQQIEDSEKVVHGYSKESLEILKKISSLIDIFMSSSTTRFSEESIKTIRKLEAVVNSKIDIVNGNEELFDESIKNKQPEMIYFRVTKMLRDYKDDTSEKFEYGTMLRTEDKINICKKAIDLIDKYKDITYLDEACLYTLINLKWLLYNRFPLLGMPECTPTKLSEHEWKELEMLCERYFTYGVHNRDNIRYLLALCMAERNDFDGAMEMLKPYKESRSYEKRALHILCNEEGEPRKFRGRLKNNYDKEKRRGYMAVYYGKEILDDNVIYRAENIHKKASELRRDEQIENVEISISFSGFQAHTKSKAYRELKEDEI